MEIGRKTLRAASIAGWTLISPLLLVTVILVGVLAPFMWLSINLERWLAPSAEWHPWFAWRPVRINGRIWEDDGPLIWWERIERRRSATDYAAKPIYRRAPPPADGPKDGAS